MACKYSKMWEETKTQLMALETHYQKLRQHYAQKGQPTFAAAFKERSDGVAEAIMYMDLAEQDQE